MHIQNRQRALALLLKSVFWQPWAFIDFSWGISAALPGLLFGMINLLAGARLQVQHRGAVEIHGAPLMPAGYGVSLGPVLLGGRGFGHFAHEYGHTLQNRLLGPFFYPLVALPSVLSVYFQPRQHSRLYCERWADAWSRNYASSKSGYETRDRAICSMPPMAVNQATERSTGTPKP